MILLGTQHTLNLRQLVSDIKVLPPTMKKVSRRIPYVSCTSGLNSSIACFFRTGLRLHSRADKYTTPLSLDLQMQVALRRGEHERLFYQKIKLPLIKLKCSFQSKVAL